MLCGPSEHQDCRKANVSSGLHEVITSKAAQGEFEKTAVGSRIAYNGGELEVVGVFESGDVTESSFVMDASSMAQMFGGNWCNTMHVMLDDAAAFTTALQDHKALKFQVVSEPEYYDRLTSTRCRRSGRCLI